MHKGDEDALSLPVSKWYLEGKTRATVDLDSSFLCASFSMAPKLDDDDDAKIF